jgi:hypothetical protein
MNIFFLHPNARRCARWHCNKHVVKMILETTQLLYTAHWVLEMEENRLPSFKDAPLQKSSGIRGYLSIHNPKHPSAIWTRASKEHYEWLCSLGMELCKEFTFRFKKTHSCKEHLVWLTANIPRTLVSNGWKDPPCAMPTEYRISKNVVSCYRLYYVKGKSTLLQYTLRSPPHWLDTANSTTKQSVSITPYKKAK